MPEGVGLLALALGVAALVAGVLTSRLGRAARRREMLLDRPEPRRMHRLAVPRVGGIGLVTGLLAALVVGPFAAGGGSVAAWLGALLAFFGVGLLDDAFSPRPAVKLLLQALATLLAVLLGFGWGDGRFPLAASKAGSPVDALVTGLWILCVLQVINFLDGIDAILCAVSVVFLFAAVAGGAGPGGGYLYAAALGATLGAAWHNLPPARVFLGDAGSHVLAFLVASTPLTVRGSGDLALPWPVTAAMLLPAAADIALGFVSKRRLGYRFTAPHREHVYQRLTRTTRTHLPVAVRYGMLTAACLVLAVLLLPRVGAGGTLVAAGVLTLAHVVDARRRIRRADRSAGGGHAAE